LIRRKERKQVRRQRRTQHAIPESLRAVEMVWTLWKIGVAEYDEKSCHLRIPDPDALSEDEWNVSGTEVDKVRVERR
jgi:hypothetical protein